MGFILVIQNTLITLSDLYLINNSVTQVTTNQIRQDLSLALTFVRNGQNFGYGEKQSAELYWKYA